MIKYCGETPKTEFKITFEFGFKSLVNKDTPTQTPTPTVTFNYTIYVNEQYEYTLGMLGSFSGGTAPSGSTVPYQVMTDENGNVTVVQLNAISLGGFQGLNN